MKKESFFALLCIVLMLPCFVIPSAANSAQQHWRGTTGTGAIMTDGESPIVVEGETLTFDIPEFPSEYYREEEDFLNYGGKVSAEYRFYNPSDMTVTSTLAFPFGKLPDYGYGFGSADAQKYEITVNGTPVEVKLRHTLADRNHQFDLDIDLPLLSDDYLGDDFYSTESRVTHYRWRINKTDEEYDRAVNVATDIKKSEENRVYYLAGQSGSHLQKDGDMRISDWARDTVYIDLYVFGEPLSELPKWQFYADGGVKDGEEISGSVSFIQEESMTFLDFALLNYDSESGVSEIDWYNAVYSEINSNNKYDEHPIVTLSCYERRYDVYLMRWYQYEITLEPGERLVNKVVAPMYPSIDRTYIPTIYKYDYLLSPAGSWSEFGRLDIIINTPYYISESNLEGFEKTDLGYEVSLDGLPTEDGEYKELSFTLSTDENPIPRSKTPDGVKRNITYFLAFWGLPILIGVAVIAVIIFIFRKIKRK